MDYSQNIIKHVENLKHYTSESINNITQSKIPELLDTLWETVDHYVINSTRYYNLDPENVEFFKINNMRFFKWEALTHKFTGYVSATNPKDKYHDYIQAGEYWYESDTETMPLRFPITVRKYDGTNWSIVEQYTPASMELWANCNSDKRYFRHETKWLDYDFQGTYEFRENAYLAYMNRVFPAFVLFINGKFIPLSDITVVKSYRYSYLIVKNIKQFNKTYKSVKIVSIPFPIKYSEARILLNDYTVLFRFNKDGEYANNGEYIYSAKIPELHISENSFATSAVAKNIDLEIDKHVKLFPKNVFLFKNGYFDIDTEKTVSNLNLLTLNEGESLGADYYYRVFYRDDINPNVSNILIPENDSYVKQVVSKQVTDIDLSSLEEDFNFKYDEAKSYSDNISNSIKYIAEYRQSLLNDLLYKASDVVSYKFTGAEIKSKVTNGILRMLRARHHMYDTYVIVYLNNQIYENYQYLYYKANAWYMPVDVQNIDDNDLFEIVYFNRVNNKVIAQKLQEDNRWITRCPIFPDELQISSSYLNHQLYNISPSSFTRYKVDFTYEEDPNDKHKIIISLDDPTYYEPSLFVPNPDDFHCVNWTLHWDANNELQFYSGSVLAMTLNAEGKLSVNDFKLPFEDDSEDFIIGDWTLHQSSYKELLFIHKQSYIAMTLNGSNGNLKCDNYSDNETLTNPGSYAYRTDIGNGWYLAQDSSGNLRFGNDATTFAAALLYPKEMFTSKDLDEHNFTSTGYNPTQNYININSDWQFYAEDATTLIIIYKHMSQLMIKADGTVYTLNDIDESYNTSTISYAGSGTEYVGTTGVVSRIDKKHPVGKDWYLADDTKKMLRFICNTSDTISVLNKDGQLYLNEMLNSNYAECLVDIHSDDLTIGNWIIHHNDLGELLFIHKIDNTIPVSFNDNGELRASEYVDNEDLNNTGITILNQVTIGNGWSIAEDNESRLRFISTSSTSAAMMIHPEDWIASSSIVESDDSPESVSASSNVINIGDWALYAQDADNLKVLYNGLCYITIHSDGTITTVNGLLENYVVKAITPYPSTDEFTVIGPWKIYASDTDNLKFLFKDYCILTITKDSQYILPGAFTEYLNKILKVKLTAQADKNVKIYVDNKELTFPMYVSRDKYVTIKATKDDSIKDISVYIKESDTEEYRNETLYFSSINQFRYICYNNTRKNAAFDLGYDFRECLDVERYMVCINGKTLNDTMFRILLPGQNVPFTGPCVHTSVMVQPGDRVEIFYLPCTCKNIDVNNFDKVTTDTVMISDPTEMTYDIPFPIPNYAAGRNGFVVLLSNIIVSPDNYTIENDKITFTDISLEGYPSITFVFFYNENVTEETYDEEDLPNIEQYGYIYLDRNRLKHSLSKDLYFLFINGKKVDKDSILDITSNIFRVKRDIRTRTHVALIDHTVDIPEVDELCKVLSRYDMTMNRISFEFLNKLFNKYNRISDTDPRLLNDISQEALINDIVRYHYTSQAFAQSLPFIYTYNTKYYTDKDIYGNFIITTMNANKENFPDYSHDV